MNRGFSLNIYQHVCLLCENLWRGQGLRSCADWCVESDWLSRSDSPAVPVGHFTICALQFTLIAVGNVHMLQMTASLLTKMLNAVNHTNQVKRAAQLWFNHLWNVLLMQLYSGFHTVTNERDTTVCVSILQTVSSELSFYSFHSSLVLGLSSCLD